MRQICHVASVRKCDLNKVPTQLCLVHTSAWLFVREFAPYSQGNSAWEHLGRDAFVFHKGIIILYYSF